MSKTELKRELKELDKEQIIELVLDAYSAKREIKAYFDFFLNPNADTMFDGHTAKLKAEIFRSKWGRSKMRVSKVRNLFKDFASFNPGLDYELRLMYNILSYTLCALEAYSHTESMRNMARWALKETITRADRMEQLGDYLKPINDFLANSRRMGWIKPDLKDALETVASDITRPK